MSAKLRDRQSKPVLKKFTDDRPDYRSKMSDRSKKIKTLPIYKEDKCFPEAEIDHLFLCKNILN
jgi:hypothetical protein